MNKAKTNRFYFSKAINFFKITFTDFLGISFGYAGNC